MFECDFRFSKEDGASFTPQEVLPGTPYKITYEGPTSVAQVKFHIVYKQ